MPQITILNEQELRAVLALDADAVTCVEDAFRLLEVREVVMPPILSFHIPDHNGEVDVKTAYVPGIPSFAIKMSPGFFDNPKKGLPSLNGLMVVFAAETGLVEAVLLDNGFLTDLRTAAAGAVAAKWLSRPDASVAGILGTGVQARLQLQALTLVRDLKEAWIWGRNPERAAQCAQEMSDALGFPVQALSRVEEVLERSDLVVTTTPATEPLLEGAWLRPGQHITAMGSDAPYKNELAPSVLERADWYICDRLAQCRRQGELRPAVEAGVFSAEQAFPELGAVIAGTHPGRTSAAEITVCDLTGTGVQDTAIATLAVQRATAKGSGTVFSNPSA